MPKSIEPQIRRKPLQVLLTGATGTLGFNIARLLASDLRYHVILPIRRLIPSLAALGTRIEMVEVELRKQGSIEDLFARTEPDIILHCAVSGLRSPRSPWFEVISFNVETTLRLFESYCVSRASHFIHISTGLVYREQARPIRENDPVETLHRYGVTKLAAELLLEATAVEFNRRLTIIRPFAFTGLRDFRPRLFPSLIHAAAAGEQFPMTSGDQIRDFCAVEDIARAIVLCIERVPRTLIEKFNLGGGIPMSVRQWVESVCSDLELAVPARFGQIGHPANDPAHLVADVSAALELLGWYPTTSLSYAVWELAQEIAPGLPLRKPERFLCQKPVNSA